MSRRYFIFLVATLLLMAIDRSLGVPWVRGVSQMVLTPVTYSFYQIGSTVINQSKTLISLPFVYQENQLLVERERVLQEQLVNLRLLEQENQALREQLGVLTDTSSQLVLAEVVGFDEIEGGLIFVVNKGRKDGVLPEQAVVLGRRLIGTVSLSEERISYVRPIFASDNQVPARIFGAGSDNPAGLLLGQYNKRLVLTNLLQQVTVQKGDLVVSSGEGGLYPSGLFLGTVNELISAESDVFKSYSITPVWDLKSIGQVFIQVQDE